MLNKFTAYYQNKKLFNKTDKILLTVSGGMDSVFMVHLFLKAKIDIAVAHCNFKLRGDAADKDEELVRELAKQHNIPFHAIAFNTKEHAEENGISIQMAARELRYAWFEEIRKENNYNFIATAHHKNDVAETMLINLTKGTGIAGLHGIKSKSERIIRPLLCFTRKEVEALVKEHSIQYREDVSNADTKYVRNKIRHQVIPALEEINPNTIETLNQEAAYFSEIEAVFNQKIREVKEECFTQKNDVININIDYLLSLSPLKTYLYYLIRDYGFNGADVADIIFGLNEESGKTYFSATHQILKDRKQLVLREIILKEEKEEYTIKTGEDFTNLPINIKVNLNLVNAVKMNGSSKTAYLDASKIGYPLTLRRWKQGDAFQPLGMNGRKKVSDFFIDKKLNLDEKASVWILTDNKQIIWILGHQIDDKFKITAATKDVISLEY